MSWIRQVHRWVAVTFTVTVIVVIVSYAVSAEPPLWLSLLPLLPLLLMMVSGLCLFVQPYLNRRRTRQA